MKITRNNYEPYFMDYFDGNLSDAEINMLEKFLLDNPDLREELEGTEKIIIQPETIIFDQKDLLKRPDLSLPVNKNNFEDFCIAGAEGDLNESQESALNKFIRENSGSEKTYSLYSRLKLAQDNNIVFPGKENLKKKIVILRREILYPALSVAAAIAFLFVIYLRKDEVSKGVPGMTATVSTEVKAEPPAITEEKQVAIKEEAVVQQASVIAYNFQKEKKQTITNKTREIPAKSGEDNKGRNSLPAQKLNPSVRIKLPSVADNQIYQPSIEGNKITYTAVKTVQSAPEYLTLTEYARKQVNEKLLGNKEKENTKLTGWTIAESGISGINKLTGSKMKLETKTTGNGDVTAYAFSSRLLSFSSTARK